MAEEHLGAWLKQWMGMAQQHPGRKVFQQSQGHGPGSDCGISAHPHMVFEVRWFSIAFTGRDLSLPLSLSASALEHGDLPASKL